MFSHGWVEKAVFVVIVGYLAGKLVNPLLDKLVGRFIPQL